MNVFFGDMPEAIFDTNVYFNNTYKDSWIESELGRQMIEAIDKSEVESARRLMSPVLGAMTPLQLSGGVKTLLLIAFDRKHVFNASTCGDNCAPWILEMAADRKVTINLRHLMDFGRGEFKIRIMNTGKIVHNMTELVHAAGEYV